MLNALPDTQLWKRLEKEGRLLGDDATGNNTIATVNFIPKMDVDKLITGYQRIMRTIYKPSEYYRRALDSLQRTPQEIPEAHQYHGIKAGRHLCASRSSWAWLMLSVVSFGVSSSRPRASITTGWLSCSVTQLWRITFVS